MQKREDGGETRERKERIREGAEHHGEGRNGAGQRTPRSRERAQQVVREKRVGSGGTRKPELRSPSVTFCPLNYRTHMWCHCPWRV